MNTSINQHLVKAIAEISIFLEFTSRDLLDEDAAVEALEQLACELQLMHDDELRDLSLQLKALSSNYRDEIKSKFIKSLPKSLGLE